MATPNPAIQGLLDDLADTLDIEMTALGLGGTPYLVLVLPEGGPHICGTFTPEGLDTAAKLLSAMATEMREAGVKYQPRPN